MKQLITIIIVSTLATVVILTGVFTSIQIKRSRTIDETLVSSLTTQLETVLIQQVYEKTSVKD